MMTDQGSILAPLCSMVLEGKDDGWRGYTTAGPASRRPPRLLEGDCSLPQERSSDRPALGEELGFARTPPRPWQTGHCLRLQNGPGRLVAGKPDQARRRR